jgi:glutamate synthase (NADPH/NADH) large chain
MTGGLVVVLGSVGRNFGAGMSGGLAFVLDEDGGFERHCNKEMVELTRLNAGDVATVKALLEEHARRTGSPKAKAVLAEWESCAGRFVKVFPSEYRQALEAAGAPATNGLPIAALSPSAPEELAAASALEASVLTASVLTVQEVR